MIDFTTLDAEIYDAVQGGDLDYASRLLGEHKDVITEDEYSELARLIREARLAAATHSA